MQRQKILFLTHRFPYPPNRGDRIRSYNLLRVLADHFDISLVCTSDEPITEEQISHVKQFCSQTFVSELGKWNRRIRGGAALLRSKSLTEAMFHSPQIHQQIQSWQQADKFDQVVVFCSSMYPYVDNKSFRNTPKIVDLVDVDSEKWSQLATERSFPMSWIYAREARAVRKLETKIGDSSKLVTLVSESEAQLYRELIKPSCPVSGISNGVDTEYFQPGPSSAKAPTNNMTHLVFTGVLDYTPNVEGMIWFCKEVMPRLREQGDFQLKVVGRRPIASVQELNQIDGVEIIGEVPDVRPYLQAADIAISPLKLARGIQNKVLEAMACGLPTIVSPQSAEGIEATPGKEFLIADSSEQWIDALLKLGHPSAQQKSVSQAARKLVKDHYSWAAKLSSFVEAISKTDTIESLR